MSIEKPPKNLFPRYIEINKKVRLDSLLSASTRSIVVLSLSQKKEVLLLLLLLTGK
jgi:hypothetical protein